MDWGFIFRGSNMKFNQSYAILYIPDEKPTEEAITRSTHMCIAAHHDDIEIMSYDGIVQCYESPSEWFFGVVVTNGSGSARKGVYEKFTDIMMMDIRKQEQIKAAEIGRYGALAMLDYSSRDAKDSQNDTIENDLMMLIQKAQPRILYTHNLADKHDTHIGVATKVIRALRKLDPKDRPHQVLGCEVWRGLDWMLDQDKVVLDASHHPDLASDLIKVFDSQISGGKRYDLATLGRRFANATYLTSHQVDQSNQVIYAMDLTPLILDDTLDISTFVISYIERFKNDVMSKINKMI
jgi:LmbE family N-acetylglucosaminyl deacetylase